MTNDPASFYFIGETLNSSSPSVHAALANGDRRWVESCVRRQMSAGVDSIDCNAGSFGSQERSVLSWLAEIVEVVADVPLCLDSADREVLVSLAKDVRRNMVSSDLLIIGRVPRSTRRQPRRKVAAFR